MLAIAVDRIEIFRVFRVIFHVSQMRTTIFQATIKLKFLTPSIHRFGRSGAINADIRISFHVSFALHP